MHSMTSSAQSCPICMFHSSLSFTALPTGLRGVLPATSLWPDSMWSSESLSTAAQSTSHLRVPVDHAQPLTDPSVEKEAAPSRHNTSCTFVRNCPALLRPAAKPCAYDMPPNDSACTCTGVAPHPSQRLLGPLSGEAHVHDLLQAGLVDRWRPRGGCLSHSSSQTRGLVHLCAERGSALAAVSLGP